MKPAIGHIVMKRLVEALGLQGQLVRRLVIDIPLNSAVTVYVERYANEEAMDALTEALKQEPFQIEEKPVVVDSRAGVVIREVES